MQFSNDKLEKYKVDDNRPFITFMANKVIPTMNKDNIDKFFDGTTGVKLKYEINEESIQSIINLGYTEPGNKTANELFGVEKDGKRSGGKINVDAIINALEQLKNPPPTSKKTYQQTSKIDVSSFKCETNEEKNKFPCNWEEILKNKLKNKLGNKVHGPQQLINDYNNNRLDGSDGRPNEERLEVLLNSSNNYLQTLRDLINEKNTEIDEERLKLIKKITNTTNDGEKGISQIQYKYDNLKDRIKIMDFNDGTMREDPYKLYNKQLYLKRNKDETLLMLSSEKAKFAFWGILAFVLGIATIINFKKKID